MPEGEGTRLEGTRVMREVHRIEHEQKRSRGDRHASKWSEEGSARAGRNELWLDRAKRSDEGRSSHSIEPHGRLIEQGCRAGVRERMLDRAKRSDEDRSSYSIKPNGRSIERESRAGVREWMLDRARREHRCQKLPFDRAGWERECWLSVPLDRAGKECGGSTGGSIEPWHAEETRFELGILGEKKYEEGEAQNVPHPHAMALSSTSGARSSHLLCLRVPSPLDRAAHLANIHEPNPLDRAGAFDLDAPFLLGRASLPALQLDFFTRSSAHVARSSGSFCLRCSFWLDRASAPVLQLDILTRSSGSFCLHRSFCLDRAIARSVLLERRLGSIERSLPRSILMRVRSPRLRFCSCSILWTSLIVRVSSSLVSSSLGIFLGPQSIHGPRRRRAP